MKAFIEKTGRYQLQPLQSLSSIVNTSAKLLQDGNDKLASSIGNFSITPVLSCRNCADCKDTCYARSPYEMRDNVKNRWDYNFQLARTSTGRQELKNRLIGEITRSKAKTAIRIHVAGDFFSQEYIDMWTEIATACPGMTFYSYTKVMAIFDFEAFKNLPNVNLINSIAADGGKNYGDIHRVYDLVCDGYVVCPATLPDSRFGKKGLRCGKDCKICMTVGNEKVCFFQH